MKTETVDQFLKRGGKIKKVSFENAYICTNKSLLNRKARVTLERILKEKETKKNG